MFAITIHNNLLKLVLPEQNLFQEIPLDSFIINGGVIIDPKALSLKIREVVEKPSITNREAVLGLDEERVYLKEIFVTATERDKELVPSGKQEIIYTCKLLGRNSQEKAFQVAAVDKKLLQSYIKTLALSGLDLVGLVPLPLSLAKFTPNTDRPNLIICLEDGKLVYILVSIYGGVSFLTTYGLSRDLKDLGSDFVRWTSEVLEFSGERVAGRDITKIFLCGEDQDLMKEYLKEIGLVAEGLPTDKLPKHLKHPNFIKTISLLNFESGDLDLLSPTQEKEVSKLSKVVSFFEAVFRRASELSRRSPDIHRDGKD